MKVDLRILDNGFIVDQTDYGDDNSQDREEVHVDLESALKAVRQMAEDLIEKKKKRDDKS